MQQPSGGFRLIVRRGPQPNQIYELNKDVITIGRDITNDITINDPEVSRHHARLMREASGYIIEDLGSTNGSFVNGQRLTGSRPLSPGETLGLGETVTLAYESTAFPGMPSGGSAPQPNAQPQTPANAVPPPIEARQTELGGNQPAINRNQPPPPSAYAPPVSGSEPLSPPPAGSAAGSPYAPPSGAAPPPPQSTPPPYYSAEPMQAAQQPPSPYSYTPPEESGGMTRWILLGCGCFIVLCIIGTVLGAIVVDATCAWDQEPLATLLDTFGLAADSSASACQ